MRDLSSLTRDWTPALKGGFFFLFPWLCQVLPLVAQRLKHLPPMQETRVRSLGWEDPLEKEMVTHSSILAWRIPWTEEPGRLQSTGSQRVGHDWATSLSLFHFMPSLSCGMWDLVPWPRIEPGAPTLGRWSFSQWTNREAPARWILNLWTSREVCLFASLLFYFWEKAESLQSSKQAIDQFLCLWIWHLYSDPDSSTYWMTLGKAHNISEPQLPGL